MKHLNNFNSFNESRSKKIIGNDPISVIKERAPWYLESEAWKKPLYRAIDSKEKYLTINPSKYKREPVGEVGEVSPLYYDTIMNESRRWGEFSNIKRENSIFCSNSTDRLDYYLGFNIYSLEPKLMSEIMSEIDNIPKEEIELHSDRVGSKYHKNLIGRLWLERFENLSFSEFLCHILNFGKNEFKIITSQKELSDIESNEVWSDHQFLGIRRDYYTHFFKLAST